ncbi:MAG: hypothetical protein SPG61_02400 [Arcanobacterium sp.]|nr:hypothetical protein [Arcanobacterium sp.]
MNQVYPGSQVPGVGEVVFGAGVGVGRGRGDGAGRGLVVAALSGSSAKESPANNIESTANKAPNI